MDNRLGESKREYNTRNNNDRNNKNNDFKSIIIRLKKEEVVEFVMVAEQCIFDISISYNNYSADAKSVFEVSTMDLSKELTLCYEGYDPIFEKYLCRFHKRQIA